MIRPKAADTSPLRRSCRRVQTQSALRSSGCGVSSCQKPAAPRPTTNSIGRRCCAMNLAKTRSCTPSDNFKKLTAPVRHYTRLFSAVASSSIKPESEFAKRKKSGLLSSTFNLHYSELRVKFLPRKKSFGTSPCHSLHCFDSASQRRTAFPTSRNSVDKQRAWSFW